MFSTRILVLIVSFLSCFFVNAQDQLANKIDSIVKLKDPPSIKVKAFQELLKKQDTLQYRQSLGALYHEISDCYYKLKTYDEAFFFIIKAIDVKKTQKDLEALNKSRYRLVSIYNKLKKPKERYETLLAIINDNGADRATCNSYRILAKIERNKGDFFKAFEYLNSGLANTKLCENKTYESLIRWETIITYGKKYGDILYLNKKSNDLEIVKKHYHIIQGNIASNDTILSSTNMMAMYNGLAVVHDSYGELDKALEFYKKGSLYVTEKNFESSLGIIMNMGIIYSRQKKNTLAKKCFAQVIKESQNEYRISMTYDNMGYYLPNANATEKIPYFKKAIHTILERKVIAEENFKLPTLTEIQQSEYQQEILPYLIDLADHYVKAYEEENDRTYLFKAKEVSFLLDKLVSLLRYESSTSQSKLFWIEKGVNLYMLAVKVCYVIGNVEDAFYFMEKNKSLLLQENVKTLQAKLALNIPKDTLKKEQQLYYKMLSVQEQFLENNDESLKEQYAKQSNIYRTFMEAVQKIYPEYVKTKQEVEIASLTSTIAEHEKKGAYFIEYILNENDGYGIYYATEEPLFFQISNVPEFQQKLVRLKELMRKRSMNKNERDEFKRLSHQVFKKLFPFKNIQEELKGKEITIIPDESLRGLPFEALLIHRGDALAKNYLIQTAEVSYLQSFSLYNQIKQKENKPSQKLLAIAPSKFTDKTLPELSESTETIAQLNKYESSLVLLESKANKENFLDKHSDFEIIHISTHAELDSITQKPWIAFYDTKMSLYELFGIQNQADLVILDACKTNDGKMLSGEGIMNLSRGFFYNGTQSVMASLWNVNENTGNQIIDSFYKELTKGKSKSKALQQAKINYLNTNDFPRNLPYYWAAFTLTGTTNSVALPVKVNYLNYLIGIGLLCVGLIWILYRRKISSKKL